MKSIALLAALLVSATFASAKVTETFKQSYPLTADGVIHLENVNGDIEIVAWDQAEVSVDAEKVAKDDDELKRMTIEVEATPTKLTIKTKYEKKAAFFGNNSNGSVHYKLRVPTGASLHKIATVNSGVLVSGVRGPVNLETVNGEIKATGLAADAHLDSVNGNLSASFASVDQVQSIKLNSVNGQTDVTLPKGASARIKTSSVNGRAKVDQAIKLTKTGHHNLAGEIGTGGPAVVLDTVNGDLSVHEG